MSEPKKGDVRIVMNRHPQTTKVHIFDGADWIQLRCSRVDLTITPTDAIANISVPRPSLCVEVPGRSVTVDEVESAQAQAEREAGV